MKISNWSFGNAVRTVRRDAGFTITALSIASGVSTRDIVHIENGDRPLRPREGEALAGALDVAVEDLQRMGARFQQQADAEREGNSTCPQDLDPLSRSDAEHASRDWAAYAC